MSNSLAGQFDMMAPMCAERVDGGKARIPSSVSLKAVEDLIVAGLRKYYL